MAQTDGSLDAVQAAGINQHPEPGELGFLISAHRFLSFAVCRSVQFGGRVRDVGMLPMSPKFVGVSTAPVFVAANVFQGDLCRAISPYDCKLASNPMAIQRADPGSDIVGVHPHRMQPGGKIRDFHDANPGKRARCSAPSILSTFDSLA